MSIVTTSAPVDATTMLAQSLPGYDATPAIAAAEQGLVDTLSMPTQQTLTGLPLQRSPEQGPGDDAAGMNPFDPSQVISPVLDVLSGLGRGLLGSFDPFGLIAPVVDALGTLGTGQFSGVDPTGVFGGVVDAFDGTAPPLQRAIGAASQDWQGGSGEAAGARTRAAVGNGAEVAAQADGLRGNLSNAAGVVAQGRARMVDIVDEFNATMAAVDTSTPDGRAVAVAAANRANAESSAVMRAVQSTLGTQANTVSAMGAPVAVAQPPGGMLGGLFGDPRLTPQGIIGNLMDLLFLPQTMTELNAGMKQMNGTLGSTNTIMTGLGGSLTKATGAMGDLHGRMGVLDKTMIGLGGGMDELKDGMYVLRTGPGGMGNLYDRMGNLGGGMSALEVGMGELRTGDGGMADLLEKMGVLDGTMGGPGGVIETMTGLGFTMDEIIEVMGGPGGVVESLDETNDNLDKTNGELGEINETIADAKRTAGNMNPFDLNKEVKGEPTTPPR